MTFITVAIEVDRVDAVSTALERARRGASRGAALVEWRIDHLVAETGGGGAVARLVRESPLPCIVTARSSREGGDFDGDVAALGDLLESVLRADSAPRYVDVELSLYAENDAFRERLLALLGPETGLILSMHDFDGRPADLLQRIETMAAAPRCAVIKVAWKARSIRDNLEAFDLLAARPAPMVALCMGGEGLMSRVLAGKFGGLLTFAAEEPETATAPGQPTIDELCGRYRFESIGPATRVYGVIGWPVGHSRGPALHNAFFAAADEDAVYLPLPVSPEYEPFKAAVASLLEQPGLRFSGASVTLPHKANLLRFVREREGRIDPLAERIGAANTLLVDDAGGVGCANTDAEAAVASLRAARPGELAGEKVAVLGAGGAARAIAVGLADAGAAVTVFNRSADRAAAFVEDLNRHAFPAALTVGARGTLANGGFAVIVNTTSVGMAGGPEPDRTPLEVLGEDDAAIDESVTVLDTVYAPEETPLILAARDRGAHAITGGDMFLRQATRQFELWRGRATRSGEFTTEGTE